VKTVQKLLCPANSSITLDLYEQEITDTKRTAQNKLARPVFSTEKGPI
jgi:hypothetical protein